MWPFCKNLVDCSKPVEDDEEDYVNHPRPEGRGFPADQVIYEYRITYMDETTESIQANEFIWSESDIIFRKDGIGVFWTRTCLVKKIESDGKGTPEVNVREPHQGTFLHKPWLI